VVKYIPVEVGERPYTLQYEITGRGVDTIYGVCFTRDHTFYQCDSTYVMDTQEEDGLINGCCDLSKSKFRDHEGRNEWNRICEQF
jgi:hypothetical protein